MNKKHIFVTLTVLILSGIIGTILLIISYLFPSDVISQNIGRGMAPIMMQGSAYAYSEDYVETILDNQTDAVMLSEALFPTDSVIWDSIMVPHYKFADDNGLQLYSLMGFINGNSLDEGEIEIYPRYWHGYITILRPLLTLFDYNDLKIFNQSLQLILLSLLIVLMVKRNISYALYGFISMLILWNPATIGVSLQYSACFYISVLGSMIFVSDGKINRYICSSIHMKSIAFLLLGIFTAYFDFLTYPLVTFGIPMIFCILINEKNTCENWKEMPIMGIHWGIGYLGMWAEKWLIGTVITSQNIFSDAFIAITDRTSKIANYEKISRFDAVFQVVHSTFFKWPYVILVISIIIFVLVRSNQKARLSKGDISTLVLLGLLPLIWFIITSNHAYIHPRLVYRNLGITVFAWSVALGQICCLNKACLSDNK